jgi:uncharacterized protein YdaU (DUF1376 family)
MKKKKTPLCLLLDIAAWQTETQVLTAAERGVFLALKMHYWRSGPIPDRDAAIAQIVGMELKEWKRVRKTLEPLFIVGDGEWFRADWNVELERAYAAIKKASEAGKKAIKARWDRQRLRDSGYQSNTNRIHGEYPTNTPSILNIKSNGPSQDSDVFDAASHEFDEAVSLLEESWKEVENV